MSREASPERTPLYRTQSAYTSSLAAPTVESVASLVAELAAAGFAAVPPAADEAATPGRMPIRA